MAGSRAVASITHSVPNGPATRPTNTIAPPAVRVQAPGASLSVSGSSTIEASPKHQGSSSSMEEAGIHRRTVTMAMDQERPAPSRNAWPITTRRAPQSIAQGPTSTATPNRPSAAATHRRRVMRSRRTRIESGTIQIVVTFERIAVRPAGTQATAAWDSA